jgi:hypothetical protein
MPDTEGYNGYTNWESFEFSAWWSNDEGLYREFIREAEQWLSRSAHEDSVELGRHIVAYARENYHNARLRDGDRAFFDLETDAEWDAIDLEEVGDEIKEAINAES